MNQQPQNQQLNDAKTCNLCSESPSELIALPCTHELCTQWFSGYLKGKLQTRNGKVVWVTYSFWDDWEIKSEPISQFIGWYKVRVFMSTKVWTFCYLVLLSVVSNINQDAHFYRTLQNSVLSQYHKDPNPYKVENSWISVNASTVNRWVKSSYGRMQVNTKVRS